MSGPSRHDRARPPRRATGAATRPLGVRHLKSETFGPYTLREQLGEGSTCAVYVAEHRESHEPLAIKVLHRHLLGDPTQARRMLDEANMISTLHHPSVVEVFDIGTSSGGRPYVVLERLIGEPLSARLSRGALDQTQIACFTRQLASALDLAHGSGIVHRDLKPENMYIVADPSAPGGERIKLLDFGIAKREASTLNTQTGIVLGTPAYMAPEQARGLRRVDGRVDIYALGIVMYVMSTGTLPFTGGNTEEMLAEHAYVDPVPPHELANIAPELSAIIQRCLAKRPDDRYPRMAELDAAVGALETQLFGAPSRPPPVPPPRPRPLLPGVDARPPPSDHSNAATQIARVDDSGLATRVARVDAPRDSGVVTRVAPPPKPGVAYRGIARGTASPRDAAPGGRDGARLDESDAAKTIVRRDIARLAAAAESGDALRGDAAASGARTGSWSRSFGRRVSRAIASFGRGVLRAIGSIARGVLRAIGSGVLRAIAPVGRGLMSMLRGARAAIVRRWRLIAIAAPITVALVVAVIVGLAPARVEITPTAVAPPPPPVLDTATPSRLEPPGLTRRQVRKPQPVIDRDREPAHAPSNKLIDRAPPPRAKPAQVATPTSKPKPSPAKPSKPATHWDPNALFFEKH